jgi:hypothetical protein
MKRLTLVLLVLVLMSLAVAALAQDQAPPPPGAGPGGGMRGMRGGGAPMPPTPVMMVFQDFIFVELGNVLYKIDPAQMKVVGSCPLATPPGGPGGMPAPPPPAG